MLFIFAINYRNPIPNKIAYFPVQRQNPCTNQKTRFKFDTWNRNLAQGDKGSKIYLKANRIYSNFYKSMPSGTLIQTHTIILSSIA